MPLFHRLIAAATAVFVLASSPTALIAIVTLVAVPALAQAGDDQAVYRPVCAARGIACSEPPTPVTEAPQVVPATPTQAPQEAPPVQAPAPVATAAAVAAAPTPDAPTQAPTGSPTQSPTDAPTQSPPVSPDGSGSSSSGSVAPTQTADGAGGPASAPATTAPGSGAAGVPADSSAPAASGGPASVPASDASAATGTSSTDSSTSVTGTVAPDGSTSGQECFLGTCVNVVHAAMPVSVVVVAAPPAAAPVTVVTSVMGGGAATPRRHAGTRATASPHSADAPRSVRYSVPLAFGVGHATIDPRHQPSIGKQVLDALVKPGHVRIHYTPGHALAYSGGAAAALPALAPPPLASVSPQRKHEGFLAALWRNLVHALVG